jgi:hypothetical protein
MSTLIQIYALVEGSSELKQRFLSARLKAAWDILNEDAGTVNHTSRLTWANGIIDNFKNKADAEFARFLSNTTIQANAGSSTDNDVQFVVNSLINTYAV